MQAPSQPPPLTPPRWLRIELLASSCIAIGAAVASIPALARVDASLARDAEGPLMLATGLLSFALARLVLRARSTTGVVLGAVFGGGIFGAMNAGLTLAIGTLVHQGIAKLPEAIGALFIGTLFGGLIGAPLGAVFGTVFAPLLASAVKARVRPACDSMESVLFSSGFYLSFVGIFSGWKHDAPYRAMGLGLVVAGIVCLVLALARDLGRLAWFSMVRAGRIQGYRVRERDGASSEGEVLPLFRPREECEAALVLERLSHDGEGPFRSVLNAVPVAVVHVRKPGVSLEVDRRLFFTVLVLVLSVVGALSHALAPGEGRGVGDYEPPTNSVFGPSARF